MDYTEVEVNNQGKVEKITILDDVRNAKTIVASMLREQHKMVAGSFQNPNIEIIEKSAKRRLNKFIRELRNEFKSRTNQN